MGLAQKRIVQEYQGSAFGEWKKKFDAVVGCDIPFEVRWDTMQNDDYKNRDDYFTWYEAVYFKPLMAVFEDLCKDNMGKEAVKAGVTKIIVDGSEGSFPGASKFTGGVFTLNHKFFTNVNDIDARIKGWKKIIEDKL